MPFDEPKNYVAAIVGLILIALGLIPILGLFNIVSWGIPDSIMSIITAFAVYVITIAGVYLLIDSFMEDHSLRIVSIVIALVVIVIGMIPILNTFGLIGFNIPFLGPVLYYVVFLIEGIFLIIAAFTML